MSGGRCFSMFKRYNKNRCYIIAEIGGNFTTLKQAKKLVDEAKKCRVDAIKLQTYRADTLTSKKAMFDFENTGTIPQYGLFKTYEISERLHKEVFEYASSQNLDWFSTPSHQNDVNMLERLGVGVYKIGSDDACNIPLLKYVARTGKPIILATGMCTMQEVQESVDAILEEGNDRLFLLHAVSSYPAHPISINLLAIKSMIEKFPSIPVGYSDHTLGTTAVICAVAMGAQIIEKHFTYDKKAEGPDHIHSACPEEMKEIVQRIREFEIMRGNGIKKPAGSEKTSRINTRKSIVMDMAIKAGEKITKNHIVLKRPGYGIPPKYIEQVIGRVVSKDLAKEDVLTWDDF